MYSAAFFKITLLSLLTIWAALCGCDHNHQSVVFSNSEKDPTTSGCGNVSVHLSNIALDNLTMDEQGFALGTKGRSLYRIIDKHGNVERIYTSPDPIQGLHVMPEGTIILSTDVDRWSPTTPNTIYRSQNAGKSFEIIKTINGGCALSWSMASDANGNLFLGEYGPRGVGFSKNVWKSLDNGDSWHLIFRAPNVDGVHIHRVAVDPFTNFLWITHGDQAHSGYHGIYRSEDHGMTWARVRDSQATAVAFTKEAIYWGEDTYRGVVTRYERLTQQFETVLEAHSIGYGGSVYDMAVGPHGCIYTPMVKYETHSFLPSVWIGKGTEWNLLLEVPAEENQFAGLTHISTPDRFGVIHTSGYVFVQQAASSQ